MNYLKISIGILIALAFSRFIPHPPNFTSLIALSFYIPMVLGLRFIPAVLSAFFLTDIIIGIHSLTFFTWGSVVVIGLFTKYFNNKISHRVLGALLSVFIFFIISNLGVWLVGDLYQFNLTGLINCYILALPFLGNTFVSTIVFSFIIEALIYYSENKNILNKKKM